MPGISIFSVERFSMLKIIMCVGIPGSGKSTWAKSEISKDPDNWVRINNDDLRAMMNNSIYSSSYEKLVTDTRNYLIREALKRDKNIIIDNLNLNKKHFDDVVKIAKSINKSIEISEKTFYIELEQAILRDSQREGRAKVGESIVKKWWKDSGKELFKKYNPRTEIVTSNVTFEREKNIISYDPKLPNAIMCDLDGTLALLNGRNPYDASDCENDLPNIPVIETIKSFFLRGYHIIFCSGREDKYKEQTEKFINKYCKVSYCSGEGQFEQTIAYRLFMRKTNDFRKDSIVKEEMYKSFIENKYNVLLILDDRDQVVQGWRQLGLTCFQVAPGNF